MSFLTRSAVPTLRAAAIQRTPTSLPSSGRRMAHHAAEYNNMPFDYSSRRRFAMKCVAYMGFGFALPFVAVGWQWYKPGGYKNP
ncbi:hypothetical protein B0H17DRAFT_1209832 [Mycena rosella]|uniref:Cytochrome c oxidase subunit 8, mitochondrial n=1 Tax=Mycena rosella TaxID=1033263 RepID=A0AAD7CXZ3_MYCRO|nr:hypothetical protein B0H17DRAFT_1209832 [Mycena rosella]